MVVEAFAIPVVLKAVDFLFGVAKDVLEERRAARQGSESQVAPPPEIPLLEQDKEIVLKRKVSEELAKQQEQVIQGILETIAIYQQNYRLLKKRVALAGGLDYTPLNVVHQLQAQEDHILEESQRLAAILDELTGHANS